MLLFKPSIVLERTKMPRGIVNASTVSVAIVRSPEYDATALDLSTELEDFYRQVHIGLDHKTLVLSSALREGKGRAMSSFCKTRVSKVYTSR